MIKYPYATSDNFWSMGDTGPCGPCTEIFYDHGEHIAGGPPGSPDQDGDRFIEIWNLVFMQYEQLANGTRIALPKPSVDTGMGLERIAALLQGVHSNYEIDLFKSLIESSKLASGNSGMPQSHNVIADHLRATSFLIADGILPSNEGRGYVLRRIMRRAMRHAHLLGAKDPLMYRLVPSLIILMGNAYPELVQRIVNYQTCYMKRKNSDKPRAWLEAFKEETMHLQGNQNLPGDIAFKLYIPTDFPWILLKMCFALKTVI